MPLFPPRVWLAVLVTLSVASARAVDFARDVLPILSDACFRCHGPDPGTREARLRLDEREGLYRTRNDITVVAPGKPGDSELFIRITSQDPDEVMPPPDSNRPLKPAEIALLREWIAEGAPWGTHWAFSPPQRPGVPVIAVGADLSATVRGDRPMVANKFAPTEHPIDAFIRERLAREGQQPSPEADRATLLRRVSVDLTGLPPTPEEVDAFLADRSGDAYERAVDRLIASPRYGERWAWDWLDVARYADTNGFQGDPERTMWPWRDWVVNAINANMPFDQFTIEQLAGDLLPEATREQKIASGFHRNTMFNGEGGRIPEETRVENVFDRVETTATVWLGATFTCARCHDHKYDPFTQRDYFALYDIFNQMSENGRNQGRGQIPPVLDLSTPEEKDALRQATLRLDAVAKEVEVFELKKFPRPEGRPVIESPEAQRLPGNLPATHARVEPRRRNINALLEALPHFRETDPDPEYAKLIEAHIAAVRARDDANAQLTRVMIMDQLETPRDTFILSKGNYAAPTDVKVFGAVPAMFAKRDDGAGTPSSRPVAAKLRDEGVPAPESGVARLNRLDLARWLVSADNPLVARVTVNRAWQAFFGTGLVKTAEDFGVQGERPSHPELLDWLATELVARGWDMKALHRLIVTSATYRQSSRVAPELLERDPENRLLARGPRHRMPSWMIRDQALAAAGLLVEKRGGPSVKPYQPPGIWEEATFGKKTYEQDHGEALWRRSLYVFWRRIVGPTTFFDTGARQVCTVNVPRTNTPLHALVTLNDPAYVEAARVMAQRVLAGDAVGAALRRDGVGEAFAPESRHKAAPTARDDAARIEFAFRLATLRPPNAKEQGVLTARLQKLRAQFAADRVAAGQLCAVGEAPRPDSLDPVEHAAWTGLCSLILNLDETLSKE